jgi:hypothetical protein
MSSLCCYSHNQEKKGDGPIFPLLKQSFPAGIKTDLGSIINRHVLLEK